MRILQEVGATPEFALSGWTMHKKARSVWQTYGENHHRAKLTDREVDQLRVLARAGMGYRKLAKMFDMSRSQVRRIVLKRQRP